MSLLRWKELAKSKSELGDKINYAHDVITKHKIGQQTSQESLAKVFKPVTSKLDDVIDTNLDLRMHPRKKRPLKRGGVPDYGIDIEDEVEDMGLVDLFDEQPVLPDSEKQIVAQPPAYNQVWADILEGKKEVYADPQDPHDLPPEYDDNEDINYTMADEDIQRDILNASELKNYETVNMVINQPEMTPKKIKSYLEKIVNDAKKKKAAIEWF